MGYSRFVRARREVQNIERLVGPSGLRQFMCYVPECGPSYWLYGTRRTRRSARRPRPVPRTLERGDARERDRYSAPERLLILRSNVTARPALRRDLVFTTLD